MSEAELFKYKIKFCLYLKFPYSLYQGVFWINSDFFFNIAVIFSTKVFATLLNSVPEMNTSLTLP